MEYGLRADYEVGEDTARPDRPTGQATLCIGTIGCRRLEPNVTREHQINLNGATNKKPIKTLHMHARSRGEFGVHRSADDKAEGLEETIEERDELIA